MAGDRGNDSAGRDGVAVLLQILDHRHLCELEVGENRPSLELKGRYGLGGGFKPPEHALGFNPPFSRLVLTAALSQQGGRVKPKPVILFEHVQKDRIHTRFARDSNPKVSTGSTSTLHAGRQEQDGRVVRPATIRGRPCGHSYRQMQRFDSLLFLVDKRLALERDQCVSHSAVRH